VVGGGSGPRLTRGLFLGANPWACFLVKGLPAGTAAVVGGFLGVLAGDVGAGEDWAPAGMAARSKKASQASLDRFGWYDIRPAPPRSCAFRCDERSDRRPAPGRRSAPR